MGCNLVENSEKAAAAAAAAMSLRAQMLRIRAPGTSFCDALALDASGPDVSWASLPLPPQNPATRGTTFVSDRSDGALGYADSHPITYRVLPPGNGTSDPRLGSALKEKKQRYQQCRLGNPDDDNPADFVDPSDRRKGPVTGVKRTLFNRSTPYLPLKETYPPSDPNAPLRKRLNLNVLYEPLYFRKQDCTCAEEALQFYNQKHGTQYQILETLGSFLGRYRGVVWLHCNFKAVELGHSPKLFLAELFLQYNVMYAVDCVMLDDPNLDIVRGCQMCGDHLSHPANLFQVGK